MFYSTLPLPPAHEHWDIYLQLCMWDDYHAFLIATCLPDCYLMKFTTLSNYDLSYWLMIQCLLVYLMNWYQVFFTAIWHWNLTFKTLSNMRHIENPGNSQNSLFRHFQGYSGTFSNIQPCSGTLRDIKSYWGISVIFKTLLPLYTTIPYSELWHI